MAKYLFNEVELPELPEWDKEAYPYAVICLGNALPAYKNYVTFYVFKKINFGHGNNSLVYSTDCLKTTSADYTVDGFVWGELTHPTKGNNVAAKYILWTNTDIYYPDDAYYEADAGKLFLAASYPIDAETGEEIHDYEIEPETPTPIPADFYIKKNGKLYKDDFYLVRNGAPILQEKTVTENGEVTADEGYEGLKKVTVNVPAYLTVETVEQATDTATIPIVDGQVIVVTGA